MNPVVGKMNHSFWYLATPYRAHPRGREAAYGDACKVAQLLMVQHVPVYCPIAHGHGPSGFGLDPVDNDFWWKMNRPFLTAAGGIILAHLPGWENSAGMAEERDFFEGKNSYIVEWDDPLA